MNLQLVKDGLRSLINEKKMELTSLEQSFNALQRSGAGPVKMVANQNIPSLRFGILKVLAELPEGKSLLPKEITATLLEKGYSSDKAKLSANVGAQMSPMSKHRQEVSRDRTGNYRITAKGRKSLATWDAAQSLPEEQPQQA